MTKYLAVFGLVLLLLAGCAPASTQTSFPPEATAEIPTAIPALKAADPTVQPTQSAEPADTQPEPDVPVVAPAGQVDLGELSNEPEPSARGAGNQVEMPAPGVPDRQARLIQIAKQDLSKRLEVDLGEITLVEAEPTEWSDSSLGCPAAESVYQSVIAPGYRITLEAGGESFVYHTDRFSRFTLCADGQPER